MILQEATNMRDVGLAWDRFSTPEQRTARKIQADAIRSLALTYKSEWTPKGWNRIHLRQIKLMKLADRLEFCGDQYSIVGCAGCTTSFIGRRRCEVRICEHCCRKYARLFRERFLKCSQLMPANKRHLWMHLVLTLRTADGTPISAGRARFLFKCARKLINTLWPKRNGCGGVAVLEVGQKENLHLHCLIYGNFVLQKRIADLWLRLTKDSQIVHISAVKNKKQGISYLLKYVSKPPKAADAGKQALYLDTITGLRRIHTYGLMYNCKLMAKETRPCPLCGGKLFHDCFHPGPYLAINSKFWTECPIQKNGTTH